MRKNKIKMSPLRSFLTQETLPGLSSPLFTNFHDFMNLAIKTPSIAWSGKKLKDLAPLVTNQLKCRDEKGVKLITNYYGLYRSVVLERLKELKVEEKMRGTITNLFDIAFKRHETGDSFLDTVNNISSVVVSVEDMNQLIVCMKGNGGKASIDQIVYWVKNFHMEE